MIVLDRYSVTVFITVMKKIRFCKTLGFFKRPIALTVGSMLHKDIFTNIQAEKKMEIHH